MGLEFSAARQVFQSRWDAGRLIGICTRGKAQDALRFGVEEIPSDFGGGFDGVIFDDNSTDIDVPPLIIVRHTICGELSVFPFLVWPLPLPNLTIWVGLHERSNVHDHRWTACAGFNEIPYPFLSEGYTGLAFHAYKDSVAPLINASNSGKHSAYSFQHPLIRKMSIFYCASSE